MEIEIIKQMSSMYDVCSGWCEKCKKHKYHKYYEKKHIEDKVKYIEKYTECLKCNTVTHIGTDEIHLK